MSLSPEDFVLLCELNLQKCQKGEKYIIDQVSIHTVVHAPVYRNCTFSFSGCARISAGLWFFIKIVVLSEVGNVLHECECLHMFVKAKKDVCNVISVFNKCSFQRTPEELYSMVVFHLTAFKEKAPL